VTQVYIYGTCFGTEYGDGPGEGHLTLSNASTTFQVPAASIITWSDAEIVFTLPFGAVSGDLTVYTALANSAPGDTTEASTYCTGGQSWCGNGAINATFQAVSPINPAFTPVPPGTFPCPPTSTTWCSRVSGTPSPSQYVTGTWTYNDGFLIGTFALTQGKANSNGTWPLSGTFNSNDCTNSVVSGTLDQYGGITLSFLCAVQIQAEWQVLSSGDVTSNGYWSGANDCPALTGNGLLFDLAEQADPPFGTGECSPPPLFKAPTDVPASEVPAPTSPYWGAVYPSANATVGLWQRTLPQSQTVQGYSEFAGRFVYEQNGGTASDSCNVPLSPTPKVTGLSGGGWFVDQYGLWGKDAIGMWSQGVDWYQKNVQLPCQITMPQAMYVNERTGTGPPMQNAYTSNQLMYVIYPTEVYSEVETQAQQTVEECEYYSNSAVSNKKCKP
jgi:hypothetical protein